MLVGVAFRGISILCLQGGNGLPSPCVLLPSPLVTITQVYIYNIYTNVPALAVSIPHALRVTLPLSLGAGGVSICHRITPKGNGNASPFESVAKVRRLFGIYNENTHYFSKICKKNVNT